MDGSEKQGRQRYRADEIQLVETQGMVRTDRHKTTKEEIRETTQLPTSETDIKEAAEIANVGEKDIEKDVREAEKDSDEEPTIKQVAKPRAVKSAPVEPQKRRSERIAALARQAPRKNK